MENTLENCIIGVEKICEGQNFTKEQILHRAHMIYLVNKLETIEDILILCHFVRQERELFTKKKDLTEDSCQNFYKTCTVVNDLKYFLSSNNLMIVSKKE